MFKEIHTTQKGETTTPHGPGSVPILMDVFEHVDMSRYKDEVVVKLLPIRPAFKKRRGMISARWSIWTMDVRNPPVLILQSGVEKSNRNFLVSN